MARPTKPRNVRKFPPATRYIPADIGEVKGAYEVQFDELEAIRLTDIEHLSQEECAKMLKVSRQSVQLMLENAREKIARALMEGQTILLGGGHVQIHHCPFKCGACQTEFFVKATDLKPECPSCHSKDVYCTSTDFCKDHCARE